MGTKGLRNAAIVAFLVSMAILLWGGYQAGYFGKGKAAGKQPPIPERILAPSGAELTTGEKIRAGQNVYQRYGLMDHGSVWGHGSLRGMDFSAYTLHWMGQRMRDFKAAGEPAQQGAAGIAGAYAALGDESRQRQIDAEVIHEIRQNRYQADTGTLQLTPAEAYAFEQNRAYWIELFDKGDVAGAQPAARQAGQEGTNPPAQAGSEEGQPQDQPRGQPGAGAHYGFLPKTVADTPGDDPAEDRRNLADFFFWTAWAAGTQRPDQAYSYTNNWPPDRSVGNTASTEALVWSILSILALFAVLGAVIYVVHRYQFFYGEARAVEAARRLLAAPVTPSQRAAAKFFLIAGLLFVVQILNGGLLANYTVEPGQFRLPLIGQLPLISSLVSANYAYSWAKSWHLQLAILWIAVSWMGTAIYLAPLVAGREPAGQRLLVNILFVAAVAVAVGSLAGEVLGIKGVLGEHLWFWLGHQGWEYLELGRLWQILLLGGLIFWLVIVYRAMAPVLFGPASGADDEADRRSLTLFYVFSAIFVVGFFAFGLAYGRGTHLTVADYWRWFVVHIWVESIFEFFGVAVISLFLVTLGLVQARAALRVAYLTAILVFLSGIPGTAHHYFWYGGPSFWLALGGVFSSLEPIPLILLVVRAWMEYKSIREAGGEFPYRWPLYFLTASSVWNFIGAGIFGFMINLPIINYYEHATYLTSNHGHTALFGVYGMLAIALILFSWRGLVEDRSWNDGLLKLSFWGLNGGLFLMFATGLLPIGLLQVWHSYETGFWWARSADFYNLPVVQTLGQWRIVPDLVIIVLGALPLLYFLVTTFPRLRAVERGEGGQ